jgi:hypothetical protein
MGPPRFAQIICLYKVSTHTVTADVFLLVTQARYKYGLPTNHSSQWFNYNDNSIEFGSTTLELKMMCFPPTVTLALYRFVCRAVLANYSDETLPIEGRDILNFLFTVE